MPHTVDMDLAGLLERQHQELMARMDQCIESVASLDARFRGVQESTWKEESEVKVATLKLEVPGESRGSSARPSQASKLSDEVKQPRKPALKRMDSYSLAVIKSLQWAEQLKKLWAPSGSLKTHNESKAETVWRKCQEGASWIMNSYCANLFFAFIILSNSIFLGVQLQWRVDNAELALDPAFTIVHNIYAVLFTLEALLRLVAAGVCGYFCGRGCKWNWLDAFVVTSSWTELAFDLSEPGTSSSPSNSNLRLIRILRMGRLLRVIRVVRVVRVFKALRTLVHSLVDTTKSLVWAMLLLALIVYIFSILFTDVVLDHLQYDGTSSIGDEKLAMYFGTIFSSCTTLFRSLLNGFSWYDAADALGGVHSFWAQMFHFYMAFCTFAVMNVMTGVFCNSAIKAAERDHDMVVQSLLQNQQEFQSLVHNLFRKIDKHNVGKITLGDLEEHFNDESVKAFFESLEIGAVDAWTLFLSLDVDGDHVISVEEFMERCVQLRGPARSVDLYALKQQNVKLRELVDSVAESQQRLERKLQRGEASPRSSPRLQDSL
ncbi:unnamed protein product [Effrenium voratum]|uniref:EF-hand domain-containing protein n=1 Tax=Effrenium voratum TaxID=2562239 RepID=A0AA36NAJ1_9DINO|nr:unnamed protein product [Effrenium voratum]CAJ1462254.1 unnamed protein product [Effrenium voratum]